MIKNNDAIILVTGCDAYKEVLYAFEHFFLKRWKDCPFEIWLSIDKKVETAFHYDNVIVSNSPKNLVRMRDIVFNTPYVILMQDDHWLIDDVNTNQILDCIHLAKKYDIGNLRLLQDPIAYDNFDGDDDLLEYKPGKAYRISARGGLWETRYLKKYIDRYDDFWEMERLGQKYSCTLDKLVLCTRKRVLPMIDAVHKGKYTDFAYAMLDAAGLDYSREVMSSKDRLKDDIKASILDMNPELITKVQGYLNIGHKQKY